MSKEDLAEKIASVLRTGTVLALYGYNAEMITALANDIAGELYDEKHEKYARFGAFATGVMDGYVESGGTAKLESVVTSLFMGLSMAGIQLREEEK